MIFKEVEQNRIIKVFLFVREGLNRKGCKVYNYRGTQSVQCFVRKAAKTQSFSPLYVIPKNEESHQQLDKDWRFSLRILV